MWYIFQLSFNFKRAFKEWCDHPEYTPEKPASQDHQRNAEKARKALFKQENS